MRVDAALIDSLRRYAWKFTRHTTLDPDDVFGMALEVLAEHLHSDKQDFELNFHRRLIDHPDFVQGRLDTHFLERFSTENTSAVA